MKGEKRYRLAVVDDEPLVCDRIRRGLTGDGYTVETFSEPYSFLASMESSPFDVIFMDIRMPGMDGMTLLSKVKRRWPETEVIMITGYASIDGAIEATRKGAFHYVAKPLRMVEVRHLARKAVEKIRLVNENLLLREQVSGRHGLSRIVGSSAGMKAVFDAIRKVAPLDCNVLIQGESGTGKELVAKAIHALSTRCEARFVCFNCGGFSEDLIANELFGHEKGAFTGASTRKIGLLEAADRGTVFLDEISEMPHSMQVKLLRVIQERQILRLGGTEPVALDIRIITATNKDIKRLVQEGAFREDLYYRLNVVSIWVPPLAERREDIPLLVDYFLHRYATAFNKRVRSVAPEAMGILMKYSYPGNVRELENIVERAVALCDGETIETKHLPADLLEIEVQEVPPTSFSSLEEHEKAYLRQVLSATGGNRGLAASILKIPRTTLWRKMKKYRL
jgi:two-component system response regulator AtoC